MKLKVYYPESLDGKNPCLKINNKISVLIPYDHLQSLGGHDFKLAAHLSPYVALDSIASSLDMEKKNRF